MHWVPASPNVRQAWNGVSWAVSAEFFFYLLAPFIIAGLSRLSSKQLINMAAGLYFTHLAIGLFAFHKNIEWLIDFMQYHPIARMPEFIYGIVSAIFILRGARARLPLLTNLLLFLPLLFYYRVSRDSLNAVLMIDLGVPAFIAMTVYGAIGDLTRQSLQGDWEVLEKIGKSSYALYMTHALWLGAMTWAMHELDIDISPMSAAYLFLISSLILSILVTQYIEIPSRKRILEMGSRIMKK